MIVRKRVSKPQMLMGISNRACAKSPRRISNSFVPLSPPSRSGKGAKGWPLESISCVPFSVEFHLRISSRMFIFFAIVMAAPLI